MAVAIPFLRMGITRNNTSPIVIPMLRRARRENVDKVLCICYNGVVGR